MTGDDDTEVIHVTLTYRGNELIKAVGEDELGSMDVLQALSDQVDDLAIKLNAAIAENIRLESENDDLRRSLSR